MIKFEHVDKTYHIGGNAIAVLKDLSFSIAQKEMVAIMGPSGSGKSTTMNIIGLLDKPTQGHYFLHDQEISQLSSDELAMLRNKAIGFVFQSFFLLPRLTALQNVAMPLMYRGIKMSESKEKCLALLKRMGVEHLAYNRPNEMSGGQQQRVAIARALVGDPYLILADEPTGALDSTTTQEVINLLKELNARDGTTIVIITHDEHVGAQCQRIIRLIDGRIAGAD